MIDSQGKLCLPASLNPLLPSAAFSFVPHTCPSLLRGAGKKHLRSGQDPALQILALASVNQGWMRVLLGSKQKKVLQGVIAVLGDSSTSLRSKENAAWILRRVTELSDTAKTQFAGQRENLVVAAKMLVGGYRRMGRTQSSSSPTTEVISDSPSEGLETSECESSPSAAKLDATTRSPTIADKKGTLVFPLPQQKNEDVAENAGEHGEAPAQSAFGQSASGGSEAENTGGLPVPLGECADPFNMNNMSLTGMTNTGVMFAEETTGERHTIEGNCCMALAQSALKDEVLERLGATKEILTGLIHVLAVGTEWAAQNAARAIGNIAYRSENLQNFVSLLDETGRDKLIYGLAKLAKHDMRSKSKEYAAMGIANLVVHDVLLASFGKVPGLRDDLALLQKNSDPAISAEATRAVTIINQARFGTVSWRAPKRI
jgi:hypothetical protein